MYLIWIGMSSLGHIKTIAFPFWKKKFVHVVIYIIVCVIIIYIFCCGNHQAVAGKGTQFLFFLKETTRRADWSQIQPPMEKYWLIFLPKTSLCSREKVRIKPTKAKLGTRRCTSANTPVVDGVARLPPKFLMPWSVATPYYSRPLLVLKLSMNEKNTQELADKAREQAISHRSKVVHFPVVRQQQGEDGEGKDAMGAACWDRRCRSRLCWQRICSWSCLRRLLDRKLHPCHRSFLIICIVVVALRVRASP